MERFPKCWRNNPKCKWHMGFNHQKFTYLDGACYLNSDSMFRCFDTRKIKRIDLRPYFGMTSDDWPDGEEQYFVDYCNLKII